MEKLPHQKYRDGLADKLREIRNSDPENPEVAKAKAQGYLDAKRETSEYLHNKETHTSDNKIDDFNTEDFSNRKTLRELRLEYPTLDNYLRSSYKIYEILHIHIEDGYYDYEKKEFVLEMIAPEDIQAYDGVVHGGIVSFLVDIGGGIASFIETVKSGKNVLTKEINNIKFRLPINVGDNIRVVGSIQDSEADSFTAKTTIYKKKNDKELPAITGLLKMKVF